MPLIEETLFGTVDKVQMAIERLKTFEPPEGYYLAFSGGKDSQCIYHLAEMAGVKFDAHYNITGIDPPELVRFIRKNYPNVERHHPTIHIGALIAKKAMPPTRLVRFCCDFLKERGGEHRRIVTGVRWAESVKRSKRKVVEHCFKDKSKQYVNPIIDWEDEDVWEFIKANKIKYCSLYDEGFKRLGCIGCPMAGDKRIAEFNRWPKFKDRYLRAFQRAVDERKRKIDLGADHLKYEGKRPMWKDGQHMFEWWMENNHDNPDQTVMFE